MECRSASNDRRWMRVGTGIRMTSVRRFLSLASLLLAGSLAAPAAAAASHRADLDSDGRPDAASYRQHGTHADIEVSLSGRGTRLTLRVDTHVVRLRVIDVTGDGRSDLVADSTAGLRVWVNAGAGALVAVSTGGLEFGWPRLAPCGRIRVSPSPSDSADRDPGPATICVGTTTVPAGRRAYARACSLAPSRSSCTRSISRAPPLGL
jgi:hypothetical protein